MQSDELYLRGYSRAANDVAGRNLLQCWWESRQLAEDAVYARGGLSEEQRGYAAGLEFNLPGLGAGLPVTVAEPMRLLEVCPLRAAGARPPGAGGYCHSVPVRQLVSVVCFFSGRLRSASCFTA